MSIYLIASGSRSESFTEIAIVVVCTRYEVGAKASSNDLLPILLSLVESTEVLDTSSANEYETV